MCVCTTAHAELQTTPASKDDASDAGGNYCSIAETLGQNIYNVMLFLPVFTDVSPENDVESKTRAGQTDNSKNGKTRMKEMKNQRPSAHNDILWRCGATATCPVGEVVKRELSHN